MNEHRQFHVHADGSADAALIAAWENHRRAAYGAATTSGAPVHAVYVEAQGGILLGGSAEVPNKD
jgi:hypothetical protein